MTDSAIPSSAASLAYDRLNLALASGYGASSLAAYFLVPALAHWSHQTWIWTLLPLALIANGYWATLHEAMHGQLRPQSPANRRAGRILAVLWGSSFRMLRFGHLMHHRYNRHDLDHPDCYDPGRTGRLAAALRFYGEVLGGLYLVEVATPLLYLLPPTQVQRLVRRLYAGETAPMPQLRQLAERALALPENIREIRQDALCAWGLIALGFLAWRDFWPAFLAFLLGRGLLVSLIDNVYHFRTPLDDVDFAYNFQLPRPLQALFLNMNLHRIHHRHMHAPWWQLPDLFAANSERYDGSLIKGVIRQALGPMTTPGPASKGGRLKPASQVMAESV